MGSWGTAPFDNDSAADFSGNLEHCSDEQARNDLLEATLQTLIDEPFNVKDLDLQYEFPYAYEWGIAAAAYVADAKNGRHDFTDNAFAMRHNRQNDSWEHISLLSPSRELCEKAQEAMQEVLRRYEVAQVEDEWGSPIHALLKALSE